MDKKLGGCRIKTVTCAALSAALDELKSIIAQNEKDGVKTVIFCEDRLTLVAERTVCAEIGGTFSVSVYTFARFMASETGKADNVLSSRGSAMTVRKIIEDNKSKLTLFKKLSADAADAIYDTIALLYSSRISAEEVEKTSVSNPVLGGKLKDIALVYSKYASYLEENGLEDRNAYLKRLGAVIEKSGKIRGNCVIFLGFQALTCTAVECVQACFSAASSVYGLFIGGGEDIYVNEAQASFDKAAEEFGGSDKISRKSNLCAEAELIRTRLFNPERYYLPAVRTDKVQVYEAADASEELEFIAADIKRQVTDFGERYAKISVMLPDLESCEGELSRVFARYKIPYYADRQFSLAQHPISLFTIDYLLCVTANCRQKDVMAVVSSPLFPADVRDKNIFRNYMLRFCAYRAAVFRTPSPEIMQNAGFDGAAVERVRQKFLQGMEILKTGVKSDISGGIQSLYEAFGVEEKLKNLSEKFAAERPNASAFYARAYDCATGVLAEAKSITGGRCALSEFIKILKSGFAAMKISIIPPKSDAVFVGDLCTTVNAGSNVVYVGHLTGDVPSAAYDTALLTDNDIRALSAVNVNISPKIRQVNDRKRETVALNICAFRRQLNLIYPVRLGAEECARSEIINYALNVFKTKEGAKLLPIPLFKLSKEAARAPYYCSEKLPALERMKKYPPAVASAICAVLNEHGFDGEVKSIDNKRKIGSIANAEKLYFKNDVSPTMLETYFTCPYRNFISKGLRAEERAEETVRAADTGDFVHAVLQDIAKALEKRKFEDTDGLCAFAREIASEKIKHAPYAALTDSDSGKYVADELIAESVKIAEGMYKQIVNSKFSDFKPEQWRSVTLKSGYKVSGRIDRVDYSGDMVRVIDYKTGSFSAAAADYYMGAKLQLPLYLLAASAGKRAVGAFYFPAKVTYGEKNDGVFRLQGFMDRSDDVLYATDVNLQEGRRSDYVSAGIKVKGGVADGFMPKEDFKYFLEYSLAVADKAVAEMKEGNVAPSPKTCDYCKAGGSCNFAAGYDGEERQAGEVKCAQIAELMRGLKGGENE